MERQNWALKGYESVLLRRNSLTMNTVFIMHSWASLVATPSTGVPCVQAGLHKRERRLCIGVRVAVLKSSTGRRRVSWRDIQKSLEVAVRQPAWKLRSKFFVVKLKLKWGSVEVKKNWLGFCELWSEVGISSKSQLSPLSRFGIMYWAGFCNIREQSSLFIKTV